MILGDFATITNLHSVIAQEIEGDCHSLARALARCTLLLIRADALTPSIIECVWGANKIVQRNLGGPWGDLALICHRLITLSAVAINAIHIWTTTDQDNTQVITPDALWFNPPGLRAIINSIAQPSAATYIREPLSPGTGHKPNQHSTQQHTQLNQSYKLHLQRHSSNQVLQTSNSSYVGNTSPIPLAPPTASLPRMESQHQHKTLYSLCFILLQITSQQLGSLVASEKLTAGNLTNCKPKNECGKQRCISLSNA